MLAPLPSCGWSEGHLGEGGAKIPAFADNLAFSFETCVEAQLFTDLPVFRDGALALAKAIHAGFVDPSEGDLYVASRSPALSVPPHEPDVDVVLSTHSAVGGACEWLRNWAGARGGGTLEPSQLKTLEASRSSP